MSWLLLFVPATIALEFLAPERHLLVFLAAALKSRMGLSLAVI